MTTSANATLFDNTETDCLRTRTYVNSILWFEDCAGYRVVFCRHEVLYRIALNDSLHLSLAAVNLRLSDLASQIDIATAFGHSVATQRRWESRYRLYGIDGLLPGSPTGRPVKLDQGQLAFVQRWFHQGVSNHEMARRLAVSETTIRRALHQAGLRRPMPASPVLPFQHDPVSPEQPSASAESQPAPCPGVAPVPAEPTPAQATPATASLAASAIAPLDSVTSIPSQLSATLTSVAAAADCPCACCEPACATLVSPEQTSPPLPQSPCAAATTSCPQPTAPPQPELAAGNTTDRSHTAVVGFTVDHDPADRCGDRTLARLGLLDDAVPLFADHQCLPRAGVLLAIPVLQAHGGLDVFLQQYQSLGPSFYGLRTTVVSLLLLALLRIKRPENVKEYSPEQLGSLLGLDRIAEVKTLRRKLTLLAEQGKARDLMNDLARLRLSQEDERLAFLYVDGHIREYSGQFELAKAKKAQRSVATTAATDTWLHDANGEPLLLVTCEMNDGLTSMLEPIVEEAKKLLPQGQELTVAFDRGGWSPKLFARLKAKGVSVITYRKGKQRPLPQSAFSEHKVVQEDGSEKTYWLHDQARARVGRLRPHKKRRRPAGEPEYLWLRQITLQREDGRQTRVVTNRNDLKAVEVLLRLFRRWRQENYFKYMEDEFAVDALVEYGVEDVAEEATRPNPERKEVEKERQKAKAEVKRLQAELGAETQANEEQKRRTMRGFKIAQAGLRKELGEAQRREEELTRKRLEMAKRVSCQEVKKLLTEKKLIVDAIKIMAYQCETELLKRLRPHYPRSEEEGRTLLHAAFQSSAKMEVTERELRITLAAQSSPHRSEALAQVCRELNAEAACFPGSGLCIRLAVEGYEPLTY